jgi:hypothetical protein
MKIRNLIRIELLRRLPIDFEALAGFVLVMVLIFALLLWLLYKFALIIFPSLFLATAFLVFLFIPFHLASRAMVQSRTSHRITLLLTELRRLESTHAPREQCWGLEARVREAAQAQVNSLWEERERLHRSASDPASRESFRTVARQIDEIRRRFGVAPESDRSERFVRLHLENEVIRAMVKNPRLGLGVAFVILAGSTTVMAALLKLIFGEEP